MAGVITQKLEAAPVQFATIAEPLKGRAPHPVVHPMAELSPASVARFVQLHLAPEDPVDADRVGQHDGHANQGDGQHDAQRLG